MWDNSNKDLSKVKEHWENAGTVSLKDGNLRELERSAILEALKKTGKPAKLADIGCGDGSDTVSWCAHARQVHGYDYSAAMLQKARRQAGSKVKFFSLDILNEEPADTYDVIVTKRCLINLGTFKNQKKAITKLCGRLKRGGTLIMLECCSEGLGNLNIMRIKAGLEPLKVPVHNKYFELGKLVDFLAPMFRVKQIRNFSTYYFLTRVYNQALNKNKFALFDKVAKDFHVTFDLFGPDVVGPQFLLVLKKK